VSNGRLRTGPKISSWLQRFAVKAFFLKIFRKILELVTFFLQKSSVSGWLRGFSGEQTPSPGSLIETAAFVMGVLNGVFTQSNLPPVTISGKIRSKFVYIFLTF
jgi:hypothetical protein